MLVNVELSEQDRRRVRELLDDLEIEVRTADAALRITRL